jgi:hypothetical protein
MVRERRFGGRKFGCCSKRKAVLALGLAGRVGASRAADWQIDVGCLDWGGGAVVLFVDGTCSALAACSAGSLPGLSLFCRMAGTKEGIRPMCQMVAARMLLLLWAGVTPKTRLPRRTDCRNPLGGMSYLHLKFILYIWSLTCRQSIQAICPPPTPHARRRQAEGHAARV